MIIKKTSQTLNDTQELAVEISQYLKPGFKVGFEGDLGTGKTTFIQFLMKTWGITEPVTSPTFNICKSYYSPVLQMEIHHFDLYRLRSLQKEVALQTILNQKESLKLIEWPHLIANSDLQAVVNFELLTPPTRLITFKLNP